VLKAGVRLRADIELSAALSLLLGFEGDFLAAPFDRRWGVEGMVNMFMGLRLEL